MLGVKFKINHFDKEYINKYSHIHKDQCVYILKILHQYYPVILHT